VTDYLPEHHTVGGDLFLEWGAQVEIGLQRECVINKLLLPENGASWQLKGDSARGI